MPMIWKDYLKLTEIASYLKLAARVSKAPPPLPRGGIRLHTYIHNTLFIHGKINQYNTLKF